MAAEAGRGLAAHPVEATQKMSRVMDVLRCILLRPSSPFGPRIVTLKDTNQTEVARSVVVAIDEPPALTLHVAGQFGQIVALGVADHKVLRLPRVKLDQGAGHDGVAARYHTGCLVEFRFDFDVRDPIQISSQRTGQKAECRIVPLAPPSLREALVATQDLGSV